MTLGERICYYRAKLNMSQGDLADALDVSRQSVSKWETGGSIPDLDKLVKLSSLFSITLDELVKGTAPSSAEPAQPPQPTAAGQPLPGRKIVGIVLLSMAFLIWLLILLLFGDLLSGLVLALPFTLCGIICLIFRKHAGLWCAWTLTLLLDLFLTFATGGNTWRSLLSYIQGFFSFAWTISTMVAVLHLLLTVTMITITVFRFRKGAIPFPRKKQAVLLGCGAGGLLLSGAGESLLLRYCFKLAETADNFSAVLTFTSCLSLLIDWLQLAWFILLLIGTLRFLRKPQN